MIGDRAVGCLVNSSGPMGSVRVSISEPDVVAWTVYEMAYDFNKFVDIGNNFPAGYKDLFCKQRDTWT